MIKYLPAVGDDKRALDEYNSEIMMGGRNTLNIFNECQDSLLATPLIIDLVLLAELLTRVTYRSTPEAEFENMYSVLGLLSYMLKVCVLPDLRLSSLADRHARYRLPSSSRARMSSTRSTVSVEVCLCCSSNRCLPLM